MGKLMCIKAVYIYDIFCAAFLKISLPVEGRKPNLYFACKNTCKEKTKNVKNFNIARHSNGTEALKGVNSVDD